VCDEQMVVGESKRDEGIRRKIAQDLENEFNGQSTKGACRMLYD
jgi:hypothetical protein